MVLLLGDSLKDVRMVGGLPAELQPRQCLKLGILNAPPPAADDAGAALRQAVDDYLEVYDAVVVGDGSLRTATAMLQELCAAPPAASL